MIASDLSNNPKITFAVDKLERLLEEDVLTDLDYQDIVSHKEIVLRKYQAIFSLEHIPSLTVAEFKDFLPFRNNHHWTQLPRIGGRITQEMPKLREALLLLLDESIPVEERLNQLRPERYWGEHSKVPYLGMPVLTALLIINYPEKYGVWNNTSDACLKIVRLWERRWETEPAGNSYVEMNAIFHELSSQLHIDLWTLDALWWTLRKKHN